MYASLECFGKSVHKDRIIHYIVKGTQVEISNQSLKSVFILANSMNSAEPDEMPRFRGISSGHSLFDKVPL